MTMKREYSTPEVNVFAVISCHNILAGSGVSGNGIMYGGVDVNGSIDPCAPVFDDPE